LGCGLGRKSKGRFTSPENENLAGSSISRRATEKEEIPEMKMSDEKFLKIAILVLLLGACTASGWYFLQESRKSRNERVKVVVAQALDLADRGEPIPARSSLLETLRKSPDDGRLYEALATVEFDMGLFDDSLAHGEKAIALGSLDRGLLNKLFFTYLFAGKPAKSMELVEGPIARLEAKGPSSITNYFKVNALLEEAAFSEKVREKNMREARALMQKMGSRWHSEQYYLAGELEWLAGNRAGALKNLEEAAVHDSGPISLRIDILAAAGHLALEAGNAEKARKYYHKAIEQAEQWKEYTSFRLFPLRETIMLQLCFHLGEVFTEKQATALFPVYDDLMRRGYVDNYRNREMRQLAARVLSGERSAPMVEFLSQTLENALAVVRNPRYNRCFFYRGVFEQMVISAVYAARAECYEKIGKPDKAREDYAALLKVDPLNPLPRRKGYSP
jgi:tetratricopeptide (TPR) repeat protein